MSKKHNSPPIKAVFCQFCQGESEFANLQEFTRHRIDIYFCHTCKAEYLFFKNGSFLHYSLYTTINKKMYRWSHLNINSAQICLIQKPGIPGQIKNEGIINIRMFKEPIPYVTPSNINEKIRTWLVFL